MILIFIGIWKNTEKTKQINNNMKLVKSVYGPSCQHLKHQWLVRKEQLILFLDNLNVPIGGAERSIEIQGIYKL